MNNKKSDERSKIIFFLKSFIETIADFYVGHKFGLRGASLKETMSQYFNFFLHKGRVQVDRADQPIFKEKEKSNDKAS